MPRKTTPPYIRNLLPSAQHKGMFDFTWNGITYTMPLETAMALAEYFRSVGRQTPDVEAWFDALPEQTKKTMLIQK
jgi:hypothetical protein